MIFHGTINLDYILRLPEADAGRMLKDRDTGRTLSSAEVKARAAILKARGFEVLPCCLSHDKKGRCLGHEPEPGEPR